MDGQPKASEDGRQRFDARRKGQRRDDHYGEKGKKDGPEHADPVSPFEKDEEAGDAERKKGEGLVKVGGGRGAGAHIAEKEGEDVEPEPEKEGMVAPSLQSALLAYERAHVTEGGDQIKDEHRVQR
jgi:hypothetical protein